MLRRATPALIAFGAVLLLTARGGGFLPETWGWAALPLLLVALVAAVASEDVVLGRGQAATLLLLSALVGWTALSALWAPSPGNPLLEAERTTIYLAAVAAVLLVGRATTAAIATGVLAACVVVCAWALWGKLVTHHGVPTTGSDAGRLAGPIGYSNGLGLIAAVGILLALGIAAHTRWAAAALLVLGPAFVLTYSRGSWAALGAGLLVLGATRLRDRRTILLAAMLVAALVVAGAAVALHGGHAGSRLVSASSSGRGDYWHVALDEVRAHSLAGGGAGTWARWWLQHRPNYADALDAHSLYLETLAELGAIGLVLLLAALAMPLAALRRGRPAPTAAACAAGYVAFLVHAALDWDWELPAVALAGLLCGAALLASEPRSLRLGLGPRVALVAVTLATGAGVFVLQTGNSALAASDSARDRGDLAGAVSDARRARTWQPWSTQPQLALGEARLAGGDVDGAARELEAAVRRDPGDWELWYQLALATTGSQHRQAAARAEALNPHGPSS